MGTGVLLVKLAPLLGFATAVEFPGVGSDDVSDTEPVFTGVDWDDVPALVTAELAEEEGALTEVDEAEVIGEEVLTARLPIEESIVQEEDEGIGCAEGVEGWPWKNVDEP